MNTLIQSKKQEVLWQRHSVRPNLELGSRGEKWRKNSVSTFKETEDKGKGRLVLTIKVIR